MLAASTSHLNADKWLTIQNALYIVSTKLNYSNVRYSNSRGYAWNSFKPEVWIHNIKIKKMVVIELNIFRQVSEDRPVIEATILIILKCYVSTLSKAPSRIFQQ